MGRLEEPFPGVSVTAANQSGAGGSWEPCLTTHPCLSSSTRPCPLLLAVPLVGLKGTHLCPVSGNQTGHICTAGATGCSQNACLHLSSLSPQVLQRKNTTDVHCQFTDLRIFFFFPKENLLAPFLTCFPTGLSQWPFPNTGVAHPSPLRPAPPTHTPHPTWLAGPAGEHSHQSHPGPGSSCVPAVSRHSLSLPHGLFACIGKGRVASK